MVNRNQERKIKKENKIDGAIETRGRTKDALDQSTRDFFESLLHSGKRNFLLVIPKARQENSRARMRSTQLLRLVDVPLNTGDATSIERASQGLEESARQVDGVVVTAHALVDDGTGLGNTVVGDGDGLAAVTVGHDTVGQSKDKFGGTVVGGAARAGVGAGGGSIVVGNVTRARGALAAGAGVARAGSGARAGAGGRSGRGSRRSRARLGGGSLNDGGGSGGSLGSGGRGSDGGGGGSGGLLLLQILGRRSGSGGGGLDSAGSDHGNDRGSSVATGVDGGGHVDGLPDDISDGLPNDGALVERSSVARNGKEGTSEGEGLGNGGHCERLVVSEKTVGDSQKFFACSEKKTDQTAQQ
jgi:hypothetical protein